MQVEISLIRNYMQKLRERTSALEGHFSTLEDEWQPLQRDVRYVQSVASTNASRLEKMKNWLHQNNVRSVGIP